MTAEMSWTDANQQYLLAALGEVRAMLERHGARGEQQDMLQTRSSRLPGIGDDFPFPTPPALETLCAAFGLSAFERALLLLCAGVELDASFAALCASGADTARPYATFGLALAALPEAHWSALTPDSPLRRWRLIEVATVPGTALTASQLTIDERVLHFLTGVQYVDERLAGLVQPFSEADCLVPSHQVLAEQIGIVWMSDTGSPPAVQLCGAHEHSKRAVAAAACVAVGLRLFVLAADAIPANPAELEGLARLWEREAALASSALYVDAESVDSADPHAIAPVTRLIERLGTPLLFATRDRWPPLHRAVRSIDVRKPTRDEQRHVWQSALAAGGVHVNGHVDALVAQFDLSASDIQTSVYATLARGAGNDALDRELWNAGRSQARPRLENLAQRIEPIAAWDDLVLPEQERTLLREIAAHVRQRARVYDTWGFGRAGSRGLGISSLFAGPSGTGKTMAAEVLANVLGLDLYRIDLSGVVSKYIGETEKNLRRVFDAAEDGGAILFFDEADALFGKRSEIKDSHDRYANIEINYLLQRMEAYRGIAVLATNMKGALDPAFLRRIRFIVNFPFPDGAQRVEIWRGIFPPGTPLDGVDIGKLARLSLTGGNIRNIALNAAFLAADAGEPIRMTHLARAARGECAKVEKPLTDAEIGGWV